MLTSFVFKDSQQPHCLLRNMIIEYHVRSNLSLAGARANRIVISRFCPLFRFFARYFTFLLAISLFCSLFHFFARYFNKNSKTTNQSDLRDNTKHVIIMCLLNLVKLI